jgi:hypothetical protein
VQDIGYPIFHHGGRIPVALIVPFLTFLDGSHPVTIDAAKDEIKKTALLITAGLSH